MSEIRAKVAAGSAANTPKGRMFDGDLDEAPMNPWRFLAPLDGEAERDRQIIELTRAEDLRAITALVAASRVSLLYAFSGNGKSSLINAGIVPQFTARGYTVFRTRPRPPWSTRDPRMAFKECVLRDMHLPIVTPSEIDSLTTAAAQLADVVPEDPTARTLRAMASKLAGFVATAPAANDLAEHLRSNLQRPLVEFVGAISQHLGADGKLLFVCDQFEELFVHYAGRPELDPFVEELAALWRAPELRVNLLFSMREDWVGSMIAFRRAIPDIFSSHYRLAPITRSGGDKVLTVPLAAHGYAWEPEVVSGLLDELAGAYSRNQLDRFNGVDLAPSPGTDPYVELPALQVVADRFWTTRHAVARPFSRDHRDFIAQEAAKAIDGDTAPPAGDVVQAVLRSYLTQLVRQTPGPAGANQAAVDLCTDCLYLLTDFSKHRRALSERVLLQEVNRLRPAAELGLALVTAADVEAALEPLRRRRLISRPETSDGESQYELAHDFAVRSVLGAWRELDRRRTAELAVKREHLRVRNVEVDALVGWRQRSLKALPIALAAATILTLIALLFVGLAGDPGGTRPAVAVVTIVAGALFAGAGLMAGLARHGRALVTGAVGLGLATTLWTAAHPAWDLRNVISAPAIVRGTIKDQDDVDRFLFAMPHMGHVDISATGGVRSGVETLTGGWVDETAILEPGPYILYVRDYVPAEYTLTIGLKPEQATAADQTSSFAKEGKAERPSAPAVENGAEASVLRPTVIDEHEPNDSPPGYRIELREVFTVAFVVGSMILLALLMTAVVAVVEELKVGERAQRIARVMAADVVDILTPWVLSLIAVEFFKRVLEASLLFVPLAALALNVVLLPVTGRTFGGWCAGLMTTDADGRLLGFGRTLARQFLFTLWTSVNALFLLPWLVLTPLVVGLTPSGRHFYDIWSGSRLQIAKGRRDRPLPRPASPVPGSAPMPSMGGTPKAAA